MGIIGFSEHRAFFGNYWKNTGNKQKVYVEIRTLSKMACSGSSSSSSLESFDSESDLSSGLEERTIVSLLDWLKFPSPADIARLRKIKTNEPPRGKCKCRGAPMYDPKGVSLSQRVQNGADYCISWPCLLFNVL